MKCLIAEDDLATRELLQMLLSDVCECHVAANGRDAVSTFRTALDRDERFDLLCLDIMMPEMDGHQVLRAIRGLEEAAGIDALAGVRVIMITSMRDSQHVLDAFREGCEAYIVKPVGRTALFEEMDKLGLLANTAPGQGA